MVSDIRKELVLRHYGWVKNKAKDRWAHVAIGEDCGLTQAWAIHRDLKRCGDLLEHGTALDITRTRRAMTLCQMAEYPEPRHDDYGTRVVHDCICVRCGQQFIDHPQDWRILGRGGRPFLHIHCDGWRMKL